MLDQTGVATKPLTLQKHVSIALVLGMMSCCYNVAQMLLLVYLIQGFAVQPWRHMIVVALVSNLIRPWWRLAIATLGINVQDTEREYFQSALETWWQAGWWTLTKNLTLIWIEIASSLESPFYLVLAAAAWISMPIRWESRRWILVSILVPFCACLVFSPVASARGYIVYGGAWGVFTLVAIGLGAVIATGQSNRLATGFAIFLVAAFISLQVLWCTSHWRAALGPIKCFFLGILDSQTANFLEPLPIIDWTDEEPSGLRQIMFDPILSSPIGEGDWKPMPRQSKLLSLLSRLPLTLGCVAIGCSFCRYKRSLRIVIGSGVGIWIAGSACSYWSLSIAPEPFDFDQSFSMEEGESTDYRLVMSDASLQVLQKISQSGKTKLSVFIPADGQIRVDLVNVGVLSPSREFPQEWNCHDSPIGDGIRTWTIRIKNESDGQVRLAGWMRPTDKRYVAAASMQSSVPAIELRLRNRAGRLLCLAY